MKGGELTMATLYGTLQGNRRQVTRCGSKASGLNARLKTCDNNIQLHLQANNILTIHTTGKVKIVLNGTSICDTR